MTRDDLRAFRERTGMTQAVFADRLGLGMRAYQDIENGESPLKRRHINSVLWFSLELAAERRDINLALPMARRLSLELARLITEG